MRLLLPLYVTIQTFLMDRAEAFQKRREAGQGTMEYVGMVVLVAVALTIVLGMSGQFSTIGEKFSTAIEAISGGIDGMPLGGGGSG